MVVEKQMSPAELEMAGTGEVEEKAVLRWKRGE